MKKVLSCILALTLLLSAVAAFAVQTGAEDASAPAAPHFYGFQLTAAADDKQSIRFVSVLTSLEGEKVGYKITVDYLKEGKNWTKTVDYEQETDTVYTSLLADTAYGRTAVTAEALATEMKLGSEGKGLLALVMTDVPTNLGEITFTVETYVKSGDTTVNSDESYFIIENGVKSSKKVLFREDLNDGTTTFSNLKNTAVMDVQTDSENGGYYVLKKGWILWELVSENTLKDVDHYTLEFDAVGTDATAPMIQVCFNFSVSHDSLVSTGSCNTGRGTYHTRLDVRAYSGTGSVGKGISLLEWNFYADKDDRQPDNILVQNEAAYSTQKHHYVMEIDNSGEGDTATAKVWVDGVLVLETSNVKKGGSGGLYLQGDVNSNTIIDNVKVTEGAYTVNTAS